MNKKSKHRRRPLRRLASVSGLVLVGPLAVTLPTLARAQSTPPAAAASAPGAAASAAADQAELGEITVTSERRSSSLQKTPIAITAFGRDAIQQQQISTFRDLSGRVPGLLAPKRSTAYTTQTYAMRGIGETDTYPEPAVAVYVDDVYLARTVGSLYDTPDLDRVEVLRGPQGTLYGRNSSAGAIRFITREPTAERTAEGSLAYGSYNNVDIMLRVSGEVLPDDKLNGSLSVIRHTRDGWTHSVPLDKDVNNLDITALRTKLKSQLTDKLSATFSADGMWDRSSQSYYSPVNQPNGIASGNAPDPNLTWSNTQPLNKTTVWGGSLTVKYEIDEHLAVKSVTAARGMHGPIYYDNDGVTQIKGDSYAGFDQSYETQEFNLNGEYDRFNFVTGLYYFHEYFHNHRLSQSASSTKDNVGIVTHTDNALRTRSYAGFGQVNYKLTPQFTGTLGARYTTDRRQFNNFGEQQGGLPLTYPLPGNFDPALFGTLFDKTGAVAGSGKYTTFNVSTPETSFSSWTPKLGAQYQWTPDVQTYASYSKGFKSGGYDLRATTLNGSVTAYQPQITTAYELGLKSAFFERRLTANLAVYYNKIHDFQVRATSPGALGTPVNSLINAGDAHSQGAELELASAPTNALTLGASLAYLKTQYDTFTATLPANVPGRKTLLGLDFPFAPKWQASLTANYRLPLKTAGAWRIGGDLQFESHRYSDLYNTPQVAVAAQTFVNGTINYTAPDESWSAGVAVKNLFGLQRNQAGGYAPSNAGAQPLYYYAYNEPRYVNVFINKRL